MSEYFLYGISLGLAAGLAPGPLLMLVLSETLKGKRTNGILIALSPLITDLPVVVASIYFAQWIARNEPYLGLLSIAGSIFLVYIAIQNLRTKTNQNTQVPTYKNSLKLGVITNLLSPHPYLFWFGIGAPAIVKASQLSSFSSMSFVIGFYLTLIGSKVVIAILTSHGKHFIKTNWYTWIVRLLGLVLIFFAVLLLYDGINLIRATS